MAERPAAALPRAWLAATALLAGAALLLALGGGLSRLGLLPDMAWGPAGPLARELHGALMLPGFFGAVIALERVVALRRGLWVPICAGLGALLVAWPLLAAGLWLASAAGLLGLYLRAARQRHADLPLAVEASGAAALLLGTLAWALHNAAGARLGWAGFLLLTIAGERRELSRLLRLPALAQRLFLGLWLALLAAIALGQLPAAVVWAERLWWCACLALALWLLRHDLAPRQRHQPGWAGHTAWCVIVASLWLGLSALAGLAGWAVAWHGLWLGFVFAMVFGHAPIMLPVLAGWRPRPTRWALAPLGLMAASLLLRALAQQGLLGTASAAALPLAALGHVAALLLFAAVMVRSVRQGRLRPAGRTAHQRPS